MDRLCRQSTSPSYFATFETQNVTEPITPCCTVLGTQGRENEEKTPLRPPFRDIQEFRLGIKGRLQRLFWRWQAPIVPTR